MQKFEYQYNTVEKVVEKIIEKIYGVTDANGVKVDVLNKNFSQDDDENVKEAYDFT